MVRYTVRLLIALYTQHQTISMEGNMQLPVIAFALYAVASGFTPQVATQPAESARPAPEPAPTRSYAPYVPVVNPIYPGSSVYPSTTTAASKATNVPDLGGC